MENPTIEQLAEQVASLKAEVQELRGGLNYAVYGIGNPQSDPRSEAEPIAPE